MDKTQLYDKENSFNFEININNIKNNTEYYKKCVGFLYKILKNIKIINDTSLKNLCCLYFSMFLNNSDKFIIKDFRHLVFVVFKLATSILYDNSYHMIILKFIKYLFKNDYKENLKHIYNLEIEFIKFLDYRLNLVLVTQYLIDYDKNFEIYDLILNVLFLDIRFVIIKSYQLFEIVIFFKNNVFSNELSLNTNLDNILSKKETIFQNFAINKL